MAKDPAFLFYPGDYLKDTQCLSGNAQVAYDRIMCEHMRNICITQDKLNFFTKRLSDDEKSELMHVLEKNDDGNYRISWVAESIEKRKSYSEGRRKNRLGKTVKTKRKRTSKTYDKHMENEDVNVNEDKKATKNAPVIFPFDTENFRDQWEVWKKYKADQHRFAYKGISEQSALKQLGEMAKTEEVAIAILHQSIQNGWKGLFILKQNGQQAGFTANNSGGKGTVNREYLEAEHRKYFAPK